MATEPEERLTPAERRKRHSAAQMKIYNGRIDHGLCPTCRQPKLPGEGYRCTTCKKKNAIAQKQRRERLKYGTDDDED